MEIVHVSELMRDTALNIVHISDTHLGYEHRKSQDSGKRVPWFSEVNTKNQLGKAIKIIREQEADAVIHTGDIFDHNPGSSDIGYFEGVLRSLHSHEIPVYILIGNHDYLSQSALDNIRAWEKEGLLTVCSRNGDNIVGKIDIYGIHHSDVGLDGPQPGVKLGWDEKKQQFGQPSTDGPNILCLHESINPPVSLEKADISLQTLLSFSNIDFDLVLAGHEHSPPWTGSVGDTEIWYASPTARISDYFTDARPFVNHIKMYNDNEFNPSKKFLA